MHFAMHNAADGDRGRDKEKCWSKLTLDFDRVSPVESIQTYSAMILPFWSSFRYLLRVSVRDDRISRLAMMTVVCDVVCGRKKRCDDVVGKIECERSAVQPAVYIRVYTGIWVFQKRPTNGLKMKQSNGMQCSINNRYLRRTRAARVYMCLEASAPKKKDGTGYLHVQPQSRDFPPYCRTSMEYTIMEYLLC